MTTKSLNTKRMNVDDVTNGDWMIMRLLRATVGMPITGAKWNDVVKTVHYLTKKYPFRVIDECITMLENEEARGKV